MQDRYTGDIGDYVKYGLLRALGEGSKLGVAWYLYPDESHNEDGRHIDYLDRPGEWTALDPGLFQGLGKLVADGDRAVRAVEGAGILPNAVFANEILHSPITSWRVRADWRRAWFERAMARLSDCEIVFADPDNGLCADEKFRPATRKDWKRMPLEEARRLSADRTAIIYHHNSRRPGGHRREIEHWLEQFPGATHALYWRRYSNRTFFVLNASGPVEQRLRDFTKLWGHGAELIGGR